MGELGALRSPLAGGMAGPYHCSVILQEHWLRFGCDQPARVVWQLPDGSRRGFCWKHERDVASTAARYRWLRDEAAAA